MVCKNCGTKFESNFCPHCGAPAPVTAAASPVERCPNCGSPLEKDICPVCGGIEGQFSKTPVEALLRRGLRARLHWRKMPGNLFLIAWYGFWTYMLIRATQNQGFVFVMYAIPIGFALLSWLVCFSKGIPYRYNAWYTEWNQTSKEYRTQKYAKEEAQREAKRARIAYNRAHGIPTCPKCTSQHLQALGANRKYTEMVCLACGYRWSAKNRR